MEDLNKTEAFNPFSEKSKELIWSPAWATRNTLSFARPLLRYNALIAHFIGTRALYTAHAANACSLQKGIDSWTRQDTTSCLSPATLSKRILHTVPDMDNLCGSACTSKHMICWGKHASTKVVVTKKNILERWHDDDKYCKSFSDIGWTEEQIIQYDAITLEDHSYVATWEERSKNGKSWKLSLNAVGVQRPLNESAQRLDRSEAKMKKTMTNNHWRWKQTNPSWTTSQATAWSTIWMPRRIRLPTWTSYRMTVLPFLDAFIFVIALATKQRLEVKSKLEFVASSWTEQ